MLFYKILATICEDGRKPKKVFISVSILSICSNNIIRTYGIISCFFRWLTAKYTNSNAIIKNYAVLKITHKEPFPNLSECAVVPRRFSQKWDVIWSPDHYPCLVLGLVYWKQEKHLWALVFSSYRSSKNITNFNGQSAYDVIYVCLWFLPFSPQINIWGSDYFQNCSVFLLRRGYS